MRALLIYPPLMASQPDTAEPEPPLGLAYIAGVLEAKGHEVKILDALASGLDNVRREGEYLRIGLEDNEITGQIKDFNPDIVGISAAYTETSRGTHHVAQLVKEVDPTVPVVAGGAHASALPENVLQDDNVDLVVLGEGEVTFSELTESLLDSEKMLRVPGTVVRNGNGIRRNPPREPITDLDSLPLPARHLLSMERYFQKPPWFFDYTMRSPRTNVVTSRGCPRRCVFCSIHCVWGHHWRPRAVDKVVDEIEMLVRDYGVREIAFVDDNLTLKRARTVALCDELIRRNLDIRWCTPNGVAIWTLDREVLQKMKRSGCWRLSFGIESGSRETQRFIGKIINLDKAKEIIKMASELGIWTHGFFVIGFPYETRAAIEETINFAINSELDWASFYIAHPYPGTSLHDVFVKENLISEDYSYRSLYRAEWDTKHLSRAELDELQAKATASFLRSRVRKFLNPWRLQRKIRSFEEAKFLARMAKVGLTMRRDLKKSGQIKLHISD